MSFDRLFPVLFGAILLFAPVQSCVAASVDEDSADHSGKTGNVVATGDFNGDGIADIIRAGPHVLDVLLGKSDGAFRHGSSYPLTGEAPRALVVRDFNGDGNLDVIVGDEGGTIFEFAGDGQGGLTAARDVAVVGSVVSIAAGVFTQDHRLDLIVSDESSNSAIVLLGAGDGTFRQIWSFQLPQIGKEYRLAAVDFNRDGIADIVITSDDDEGNYEVMLGNGNGTFTYAPQLSHLRDPNSYCPT
ncbi:MAG: VCBS repeat-containing protein [Acidobacteria bacterium]|nr:VCBS repeat-containing protein [Acidobacteriota bacterium]